MRLIIALVFIATISMTAFSQAIEGSNQTTSLIGGRWEFFMSDITIRLTFKIDKFTGDVFALVERKDKTLTWEPIKKEESIFDIQKEDVINYQLFSSGRGIRNTYLLNTNSGLTWILVSNENEVWSFQKVQ